MHREEISGIARNSEPDFDLWTSGGPPVQHSEIYRHQANIFLVITSTFLWRRKRHASGLGSFFALLGGGVKEPGWLNTQLSKSRLAVVPGYSHYNFITSAEVPQIIGKFLAHPLTNPPRRGGSRLAGRADA
jgi:hypothetical protein